MFTMEPVYQMEYQFGYIKKPDVASYVEMGIITADDYQKIVGEPYAKQGQPQN